MHALPKMQIAYIPFLCNNSLFQLQILTSSIYFMRQGRIASTTAVFRNAFSPTRIQDKSGIYTRPYIHPPQKTVNQQKCHVVSFTTRFFLFFNCVRDEGYSSESEAGVSRLHGCQRVPDCAMICPSASPTILPSLTTVLLDVQYIQYWNLLSSLASDGTSRPEPWLIVW